MIEPEAQDELERLATLTRADAATHAAATNRPLLRARFLERVDTELGPAERTPRSWRWLVPALAAGLAFAVWILLPSPLEFELEGATLDGAYVRAPSEQAVTVRFSDQTSVHATPSSRLRIEKAGWYDARVVVERGEADVHVVRGADREWTFVAGPFEVLVTGTRFSLDWDPVEETFDLVLKEGMVEVRGPKGSGPVAVRAGQRFRGDAKHERILVSDAADPVAANSSKAPAVPPLPASEPAVSPDGSVLAPRPAAARVERSAEGGRREHNAASISWQQRMASGEFADIIAEAEARGFEVCLSACSADDLRAFSDAARYTGKVGLAEQGLLALRRRFGTGAGRDAAFLLGRLAEQRGAMAGAETWYQTYLREAPGDAFAAEALAGGMRSAKALRGVAAARPLAQDYLRRFPKGVHAAKAREILARE